MNAKVLGLPLLSLIFLENFVIFPKPSLLQTGPGYDALRSTWMDWVTQAEPFSYFKDHFLVATPNYCQERATKSGIYMENISTECQ